MSSPEAVPDVVIGTPLPIDATGAGAVKLVWSTLLTAFPDIEVTVEDVTPHTWGVVDVLSQMRQLGVIQA